MTTIYISIYWPTFILYFGLWFNILFIQIVSGFIIGNSELTKYIPFPVFGMLWFAISGSLMADYYVPGIYMKALNYRYTKLWNHEKNIYLKNLPDPRPSWGWQGGSGALPPPEEPGIPPECWFPSLLPTSPPCSRPGGAVEDTQVLEPCTHTGEQLMLLTGSTAAVADIWGVNQCKNELSPAAALSLCKSAF